LATEELKVAERRMRNTHARFKPIGIPGVGARRAQPWVSFQDVRDADNEIAPDTEKHTSATGADASAAPSLPDVGPGALLGFQRSPQPSLQTSLDASTSQRTGAPDSPLRKTLSRALSSRFGGAAHTCSRRGSVVPPSWEDVTVASREHVHKLANFEPAVLLNADAPPSATPVQRSSSSLRALGSAVWRSRLGRCLGNASACVRSASLPSSPSGFAVPPVSSMLVAKESVAADALMWLPSAASGRPQRQPSLRQGSGSGERPSYAFTLNDLTLAAQDALTAYRSPEWSTDGESAASSELWPEDQDRSASQERSAEGAASSSSLHVAALQEASAPPADSMSHTSHQTLSDIQAAAADLAVDRQRSFSVSALDRSLHSSASAASAAVLQPGAMAEAVEIGLQPWHSATSDGAALGPAGHPAEHEESSTQHAQPGGTLSIKLFRVAGLHVHTFGTRARVSAVIECCGKLVRTAAAPVTATGEVLFQQPLDGGHDWQRTGFGVVPQPDGVEKDAASTIAVFKEVPMNQSVTVTLWRRGLTALTDMCLGKAIIRLEDVQVRLWCDAGLTWRSTLQRPSHHCVHPG